jgi:hypothetical protein
VGDTPDKPTAAAIPHQHIDSISKMPRSNADDWLTIHWPAPIAIVMAPPFDHNLGAVPVIPAPVLVPVIPAPVGVPIPVSLAYFYPSAAEPDIGALGDDHRFVDNDQGTGKCRHGEERNNTEGENSFLHGTLLSLARPTPRPPQDARMALPSLYRIDQR